MNTLSNFDLITRLLTAAVRGSIIGFERERLLWAAGIRTHMVVCVGAHLIMIVSAFGFADSLSSKNVVLDPSRVAAQVVLSAADGHVEIAWSRTADGRLSMRWIESGGPPVTPPTHRGFGTSIMENIIAGQLRGEVHFDWRDQGLTCEIALSLA
jgi:hypothetical protein